MAVVIVLPVLLTFGTGRLRALAGACDRGDNLTGSVVGSPGAFVANQPALVHEQDRLPAVQLAAVALVFLLRCTLDTETMTYYHAPLFATLLARGTVGGGRFPIRAIACAAAGLLIGDRLGPSVIGANAPAWLCATATISATGALIATMRRSGMPTRAFASRAHRATVSARAG